MADRASRDAPIRVAIVEDDAAMRDGLRMLVDGTPGYSCSETHGSVDAALCGLTPPGPDVLLLDIHLPGMPGSAGVALLKRRFPRAQIVMLTVYSEEDRIFESICNGACGYLLKRTAPAQLLAGIQEAHEGGAPMTPEIARKVVALFQRVRPVPELEHDLTPHEVRLLKLLADGATYEDCGARLDVSVNTVRNHIRSIYGKLHVHSKSEAVSKALRAGII